MSLDGLDIYELRTFLVVLEMYNEKNMMTGFPLDNVGVGCKTLRKH